jgi:hypothetical protein
VLLQSPMSATLLGIALIALLAPFARTDWRQRRSAIAPPMR